MNIPQFLPAAASALGLLLSIWLFISNSTNSGLQEELRKKQDTLQGEQQAVQIENQKLQAQQEQITTGIRLAQEVGPAVLKDVAGLAVQNKNEPLKKLLGKYGITIQEGSDAAKTEPPKPAPERPAEPAKQPSKP
jgi:hypothetical protein